MNVQWFLLSLLIVLTGSFFGSLIAYCLVKNDIPLKIAGVSVILLILHSLVLIALPKKYLGVKEMTMLRRPSELRTG